jgi:hypothetical protein
VVAPTEGQEDEEGVSLDVWGVFSDFHHGFLTILDNVLSVDVSAPEAKSKLPNLTLTQEAS